MSKEEIYEIRPPAARIGQLFVPLAILVVTTTCLVLQKWDAEKNTSSRTLTVTLPEVSGWVLTDDILASSNHDFIPLSIPSGVNSHQFLALGYLTEDEQDLSDLANYCVARVADGHAPETVIPLATPRGDGRDALLQVSILQDRPAGSAWSNWYQDASRVPVLVARSCLEGDGGYVIFLDGSAKYFPYARGSVWPLTRHGIGSIRTIANPVVDTK